MRLVSSVASQPARGIASTGPSPARRPLPPGAVDDDVEPAEGGLGRRDRAGDLLLVGQLGGVAADAVERDRRAVDAQDLHAGRRERGAHGAADAPARAGDERGAHAASAWAAVAASQTRTSSRPDRSAASTAVCLSSPPATAITRVARSRSASIAIACSVGRPSQQAAVGVERVHEQVADGRGRRTRQVPADAREHEVETRPAGDGRGDGRVGEQLVAGAAAGDGGRRQHGGVAAQLLREPQRHLHRRRARREPGDRPADLDDVGAQLGARVERAGQRGERPAPADAEHPPVAEPLREPGGAGAREHAGLGRDDRQVEAEGALERAARRRVDGERLVDLDPHEAVRPRLGEQPGDLEARHPQPRGDVLLRQLLDVVQLRDLHLCKVAHMSVWLHR